MLFEVPDFDVVDNFIYRVVTALATLIFHFGRQEYFNGDILNARGRTTSGNVIRTRNDFRLVSRFLQDFGIRRGMIYFIRFISQMDRLATTPIFRAISLTFYADSNDDMTLSRTQGLFTLIEVSRGGSFMVARQVTPCKLFDLLSKSTRSQKNGRHIGNQLGGSTL